MYSHRQGDIISGSIWDAAIATTDTKFKEGRVPYLGQRVALGDGRVFYFARAGGTITIGDLLAATPNEANIAATRFGADTSTAPVTGEGGGIGDTIIRITDDVSGVTADEYAGGYLCITDDTGEGQMRRIKSNQATGSAGTGWTVTLWDGLTTALDNTSVGTMINHWTDGVVVHTGANYGGTATELIVGAAQVGSASGSYFWMQTWGPCLLQAGTGTVIQGATVQAAEDDNGSVQVPVATENRVQVIGAGMEAIADGVWGPVFLQICP